MNTHYRGGLVGPILLIGLGLVLLAQNLGWVGADLWWNLLRMWPLILIAIGIDLLIPRRSALGTLLALVLVVAVFVGGFWLSGISLQPAPPAETESVSVPALNVSGARIRIQPPAASLHVHALPGSQALVEGSVPRSRTGKVQADWSTSGSVADVEITAGGLFVGPLVGDGTEAWRLGLSPEVPLHLEISSGAGIVEANLTGLQIEGLEVSLGLGRSVITLPAGGNFRGSVSGAVGQTVVIIPEGAAVRVRMTTGLGGVETPEGRRPFDLGDNEYTSPGFDTAPERIELEIDQALGQIIIRHD